MSSSFHMQDPSSDETKYHFEALLEALEGAKSWTGVFAFASVKGVDTLVADERVQTYLKSESAVLIVGIDAVTNKATLERLAELESEYEGLRVFVFWNPTASLFHPKFSVFSYGDDDYTVLVGSGNLTPGGLAEHFEAYGLLRTTEELPLDLSEWNEFQERHKDNLKKIDDNALERAAENKVRSRGKSKGKDAAKKKPAKQPAKEFQEAVGNRLLVAQIPKGGRRWQQAHFNKEAVEQFFRIRPNTHQRGFLYAVAQNGDIGEPEIRRCVYSDANKNHKIELGSRHGERYPEDGKPLALFLEIQLRRFLYVVLMPDEPGFDEMHQLLGELPHIGKGDPRAITDLPTVQSHWEDCPFAKTDMKELFSDLH